VSPSVFIPLAEELGLIHRLGALVLGRACAQAKAWQSAGLGYRVAVNLSVGQLKHPGIVAEVEETLRRCGLEAGLLELEITESTAMTEVEEGIEKLQQLRELGIHLSIDDFGTAYSSLAYLKRLPVHSLKIDRSFVGDLGGATRPADTGVVEAILALGKSLGLSVVAEGVETEGQRQTLLQLGCDQAQGYLFAPPLDPAQVERVLRAEVSLTATL
jgi:EAL domain-containing protein (putative c-di-GMP-specific phosphodiesterase class I)